MQNKILQRKRALRTALLVLLLGVAGMTKSLAQEFVYGDLKYSITYLGPYFWGNYVRIIGHVEGTSASGDLTIPGEFLYDNNGYQVVGIGNDAFKDCTGLNSVTIHSNYSGPDIFFDIESHAFEGCTMLSSFSVTTSSGYGTALFRIGSNAFAGCTNLNQISLPKNVKEIGQEAFSGCTNVTSFTIPDSVNYIGGNAFKDCINLREVHYNTTNCSMMGTASKPVFEGCNGLYSLIIGENVESIPDYAFYGCSGIPTVSIPNTVKSIGNRAFSTTGLTSITIPNSVTYIADYAFAECFSLVSIEISNSVSTIGTGTFYGCNSLASIEMPNSVTSIGQSVFMNCVNLSSAIINNSIIGESMFRGCIGLTSIDITNSVTAIGEGAFSGCSELTSITIPNSVIQMGGNVFSWCTNIREVYYYAKNCAGLPNRPNWEGCLGPVSVFIGDGVEIIPDFLFQDCSGMTSVTISNSVKIIGKYSFRRCTELSSVLIPNSVIEIGLGAFSGCSNIANFSIPNSVEKVGHRLLFQTAWFDNQPDGILYLDGWCLGYKGNTPTGDLVIQDGTKGFCYTEFLNPYGLEHSLFAYCTNLTSVTIPNSIKAIEDYLFYGCTSINSITIGDSVSYIGNMAFGDCISLHEINFNAIECEVDNSWLEGCAAFEVLNIGYNVQTILSYVFANCQSLKEINFNAMNCSVDSTWLEGCIGLEVLNIGNNVQTIPDHSFSECASLGNIVLPNSVTFIGDNAFYGCHGFTSIIIPASISHLGSRAFGNCSRLTNIYYQVEQGLESGYTPFDNCPNLATIHIDPCVLEIGSEVFRGCLTVHFIVALGETPAVLDAGAFEDIKESAIVMVSCGNRINYYSNWNMFAFNNIIEDCGRYGINVGAVGNGGSISSSVTEAQMGEEVQLIVTPNSGMGLSSLKVCNASDPSQIIPVSPAGKTASTYKFTMPPFEVVVTAIFTANTSVNENNAVTIPASVYPNPTNSHVIIEAADLKHITISNMLGQIIYNGKASGNEFAYDFSRYETGVYLIRIETTNGVATKRVVVTR